MQVKFVDGFAARCEARGVERQVGLLLLPEGEVRVGDYVVVQLGQAVQKLTESEALAAWELYDRMLEEADSAEVG